MEGREERIAVKCRGGRRGGDRSEVEGREERIAVKWRGGREERRG